MPRFLQVAALSAFAVLAPLAAVQAAHAANVSVALFDMTAAGQGMMGQGGAGFGMMGRGGFGQGMMGQGTMGQGFGGMMGPGMMSIRTDKSSVKAGEVTFDVTNWSRSLVHEMLVVAVDNADAALPYDYAKQQVIEDQIKMLGETDELQPNAVEDAVARSQARHLSAHLQRARPLRRRHADGVHRDGVDAGIAHRFRPSSLGRKDRRPPSAIDKAAANRPPLSSVPRSQSCRSSPASWAITDRSMTPATFRASRQGCMCAERPCASSVGQLSHRSTMRIRPGSSTSSP